MSIKIADLTVTFKNQVTAVNHINLEISNGIYGLLGENGAGKTTLMRVPVSYTHLDVYKRQALALNPSYRPANYNLEQYGQFRAAGRRCQYGDEWAVY